MNKFAAQKKLSVIWFINAGIIGFIFVVFCLTGKFGDKNSEGLQWYSQNIVPTLTLMIGTFTAMAGQSNVSQEIEKFYFNLSYWISVFYLLVLYLVILSGPFVFNNSETSFVDLLNSSKLYLNVFQGVVTFSLGLFFTKKTKTTKH